MGLLDTYPDTYLPKSSKSLRTIDHVDAAHHDGNTFLAVHEVGHGTGTAATVLITPNANELHKHLTMSVAADKGGRWTFSENPNASGGSAIVAYNTNRNSTTTGGTVITHTPTFVSAGTVIDRGMVGSAGGNPNSITGGGSETFAQWELVPSTIYLLKFTANNASTTTQIHMFWEVET